MDEEIKKDLVAYIWLNEGIESKKATKELNSGERIVIAEPNSGLEDQIIRMLQNGNFAHASLGLGLDERVAKEMIQKARKVPQFAEFSEQQREVKKYQELLKMMEVNNNEALANKQ